MAYTLKFAQIESTTLAGAGASIADTSITLTSFKDIDGTNLAMTDFGSIGYGTLEPNNGSKEEQISFAGITQNANGTATLTTVKNVLCLNPHTQAAGLKKSHAGGVKFVISNTSGMYQSVIDYIDGIAIAGSPVASTTTLGISKLSTAPVDVAAPIVVGNNDTRLPASAAVVSYIPTVDEKAALVGTGTPSAANKYITQDLIPGYATGPIVRTYLNAASPATWTKPANLKYVIVEVQAGGGGGGGCAGDNDASGGGGGGGYSKKLILAASLGATETATIGAGGTAGSGGAGGTGGASSFGAHATTNGGVGGAQNVTGGAGGSSASGDVNITGGEGGMSGELYSGSESIEYGGYGGGSKLGGSVTAVTAGAGQVGRLYGGGGSGAKAPNGGGATLGGAGAAGIVIVEEHYI